MPFTIERLRTMVLAAGILLMVALGAFLVIGKMRSHFNIRELPKRLGIDIQQEANGVTFSHALGAHSQFKIHASKVVQLKNDHALLHDVKIELFGDDGSRVDRIEGDEFEYDTKNETATATGPVEITLMRPGTAPSIAPKASADKVVNDKTVAKPLASAAETAASGEIHVKTSGLSFDQKTGMVKTDQRVDFTMTQGSGTSMGATYNSQLGFLVLDHAVELTTDRGGKPVHIHAQHAEFERQDMECDLHAASADYQGGNATAGDARVLFRADGSVTKLDATSGFALVTATGGHLAAPTGSLDFDEHNQPHHGHMEGGVQMDSVNGDRQIHGTSPATDLEFTDQGELKHAHLERGVEMQSEDVTETAANAKSAPVPMRVSRTWHSQIADVDFREVQHGQVEPSAIHGTGSVVVTDQSQRGAAAPVPSKLAADEVSGEFAPGSVLTSMSGIGHASMTETTATGAIQTANGDRLEAHFLDAHLIAGSSAPVPVKGGLGNSAQIQSAVLDGHVVLVEQPAAKPGAQPQPPMRATAGKAVYEGAGQWLHLTLSPRVQDGGMELTADKIDVSQDSGDAFAHGDVKATWLDKLDNGIDSNNNGQSATAAGQNSISLGGQGPAHAIAQEAQLHRTTNDDEVTFKGSARLWQQANSVAGPVIVLDRQKKSLVSRSSNPADPVRAVLLSAGSINPNAPNAAAGRDANSNSNDSKSKSSGPSVIRVRGGELDYSDIDRKAVMQGGALGTVVAETASATSTSNRVDLFLLPAGIHGSAATGQVDHLIAAGHVVLSSQGRRGAGEQLTYTGATGEYVLTGTATAPPRIVDPVQGAVTGEALIFNTRDDSVSIEGGEHKTRTDTTVRQADGRIEPHK